jgi:hypothetical protein
VYEGIKLYRERVATLQQFEGYMLLLLFAVYTINYTFKFTTPRKPQTLQLQHCPIITCSQTAKTKNIYMNGLPSSFHEFMRPKKSELISLGRCTCFLLVYLVKMHAGNTVEKSVSFPVSPLLPSLQAGSEPILRVTRSA